MHLWPGCAVKGLKQRYGFRDMSLFLSWLSRIYAVCFVCGGTAQR